MKNMKTRKERKPLSAPIDDHASALARIVELTAQLAAERETSQRLARSMARCRAGGKLLVELLGECRSKLDWSVTDGDFIQRIDNALAKEEP
jgi:hypothetical protein